MAWRPQSGLAMLLALWLGVFALVAVAQEPRSEPDPEKQPEKPPTVPDTPAPRPPAGPPPAEGNPLDTYFLRDSKGNLVPVLGMTFEEFETLLKLKQGLAPAPPPPYTLDSVAVTGTVDKGLATLSVVASIRVRDQGWVRVPLKMNKGVLRESPPGNESEQQFLTFDAAGEGYVCWLKGATAKPHVVKFQIVAAVTELGGESRLELGMPRATESSLKLRVPLASAEGSLKAGNEGLASAQSLGNGTSELTVVGAGGDMQLSWRPVSSMSAAAQKALDASGEITVRVEGKSRISSDLKLKVRSFGGVLETFRVRLPPGMEWVSTSPVGYSVTPLTKLDAESSRKGQEVEVKLDRPASGVTEVRLLATLAPSTGPNLESLQPAKFEVVDAVRQRGTIDFVVDGDWLLQWTEDASTRRVEVPAEVLATLKSIARFEFFRQPCELSVQVTTRPTRISAQPTYVVYVEEGVMRLDATLKYRIRGARAEKLTVDLADWKFDSTPSDSVIESELLDESQQPLTLTLKNGATTGETEFALKLHRDLPEGNQKIVVTLPRVVADTVEPALVAIVSANNVLLAPDSSETVGLVGDVLPKGIMLPARQQPPLIYRDLGSAGTARFVAGMQVRTRKTTVAGDATLHFTPQGVEVKQRLSYRILYESQRTFALLVPEELQARGEVQVRLGEEILPLIPAPLMSESAGSNLARFEVVATSDQIGQCELVVEYLAPLSIPSDSEPEEVTVPLVIPAEDVWQAGLGQAIQTTWEEGLVVELAKNESTTGFRLASDAPQRDTQRATSDRLLAKSNWVVRGVEIGQGRSLSVSKLLLQTVLTTGNRYERAVWRVTTDSPQITVRFPAGLIPDDPIAAIGGHPIRGIQLRAGQLEIPLDEETRGKEIVLELWYTVPDAQSSLLDTRRSLSPPQLVGGGAIRHTYWQLCLPADEHLLGDPAGYTPELSWNWRDLHWDRRGTLNQLQLEAWIGATPQDSLPPGMNQYLFSGLGTPRELTCLIVPRRILLWTAATGLLVVGLLFLHIRAIRHPSLLLLLGLAIAVVGFSWPSAALLVAQAACLGLTFLLLAAFWQWSVTGHSAWRIPAMETPSAISHSGRKSISARPTHTQVQGPATTTTSPLASASEVRS